MKVHKDLESLLSVRPGAILLGVRVGGGYRERGTLGKGGKGLEVLEKVWGTGGLVRKEEGRYHIVRKVGEWEMSWE